MPRSRRLALLAWPLAAACGDDRTQSSATATATQSPLTSGPELTTGGSAPTTGPTSTGDRPDTTTTTTGPATGSTTGEPPACLEDTIVCDGDTAQVCDGAGGLKSEEVCPVACAPGLGCVECVPGDSQCQGPDLAVCDAAGAGFEVAETCDELQGLTCDAPSSACVGACAGLGPSYIGCDYWPTVLQQLDLYNSAPKDVFAVAVANTSGEAALVTITQGANQIDQFMVAPTSVQVVALPWVDSLSKGTGPSVVVKGGAYRLRSTRPVTVYQYNPLAATTTNDASLLLPVNTWTGNYVVAAWPGWGGQAGFYAVVARQDDTTVSLQPSATGNTVMAGGGVASDGTGVVEHARDRGGRQLADRVAGRHVDHARRVGAVEDHPERDERRRDDERLGHGGVADGVGVRRGAVRDEVRPCRGGERVEHVSDTGQLEPRAEHPGGLRALSRADDGEHAPTVPSRRVGVSWRPARTSRRAVVGFGNAAVSGPARRARAVRARAPSGARTTPARRAGPSR